VTAGAGGDLYDLAIAGGRVALPGLDVPVATDIGVRDGRVVALAPGCAARAGEVVDARGLWVLPGLIDMHVHFRDPGMPHKDTFLDGTTAAAFGGVTTVCDMPNTIPAVTTERAFDDKLAAVGPRALVDFGLFVGGRDPAEVAGMARRGAIGLKIYLVAGEGGDPVIHPRALHTEDDGALWDALAAARQSSLFVSVHVDDSPVRARHVEALRRAGRRGPRDFWHGLHSVATVLGTEKTLTMARALEIPVHIAHINHATVPALDLVRRARRDGARVTTEAVPPVLDLADLDRLGPLALSWAMSGEENAAYWQAIRDGTVDAIATDHAPHTLEEKQRGREDIWEAPTGFPAVETTLPLMLTEVAAGRLSLRRMLEVCCARPARLLSLPAKGSIAIGRDADLVLVDPVSRYRIEGTALHYRVGWTPHEGKEVQGRPVATFLRGRAVVRHGELVAAPGTGRLVRPARPEPPGHG
jgi:dihydroorotase